MRMKSHFLQGRYLSAQYMPDLPVKSRIVFLLGCIQPDLNPTTYLKGSLRFQWLRGHNYPNSSRFLFRITHRLQKRSRFRLWDYYTLGKLNHYLLDAFTYVHNETFSENLFSHRAYEQALQHQYLRYLSAATPPIDELTQSPEHVIQEEHMHYHHFPGNIEQDCAFAFRVSCIITAKLIGQN